MSRLTVEEDIEKGIAVISIRRFWAHETSVQIRLTADELAEHARECLALAESMRSKE